MICFVGLFICYLLASYIDNDNGVCVEERCQTFQYSCQSEFWRASNGSVTWSAKSKTKTPFSMAAGFIHRANWPLVSGFNPEVIAQTSMIIFWPVEFACFWLLDSTDCRRWSWGSVSWSWSWRREGKRPLLSCVRINFYFHQTFTQGLSMPGSSTRSQNLNWPDLEFFWHALASVPQLCRRANNHVHFALWQNTCRGNFVFCNRSTFQQGLLPL